MSGQPGATQGSEGLFSRQELQRIRGEATQLAHAPNTVEGWKRALLNMADAADRLDAMFVRSVADTAAQLRVVVEEKEAAKEKQGDTDQPMVADQLKDRDG